MKIIYLISMMSTMICSIAFADPARLSTPVLQQIFAAISVLDEEAEGGMTKEEKEAPIPPIAPPLTIDPELEMPTDDISEHPAVIAPPVTDPEMTITPPVTDSEMIVNPKNLPADSEEVPVLPR